MQGYSADFGARAVLEVVKDERAVLDLAAVPISQWARVCCLVGTDAFEPRSSVCEARLGRISKMGGRHVRRLLLSGIAASLRHPKLAGIFPAPQKPRDD